MQEDKNFPQILDKKFEQMEKLIEPFLRTVYEWDTMDPIEVLLFLQLVAGKQLDRALEIHAGLNRDHIEAIARKSIDDYAKTGSIDRSTFLGEIIGLHTNLGTRLMKLHIIVNDLKGSHIPQDFLVDGDEIQLEKE